MYPSDSKGVLLQLEASFITILNLPRSLLQKNSNGPMRVYQFKYLSQSSGQEYLTIMYIFNYTSSSLKKTAP